jgi:hypothetical protein
VTDLCNTAHLALEVTLICMSATRALCSALTFLVRWPVGLPSLTWQQLGDISITRLHGFKTSNVWMT